MIFFCKYCLFFRCKNVVNENEQLLSKIEKFYEVSKVDLDKHLFLKENAEIVLAENEALKEKNKNLRNQNVIIQDELNSKMRDMKKEVITARNQMDDMRYVSIVIIDIVDSFSLLSY